MEHSVVAPSSGHSNPEPSGDTSDSTGSTSTGLASTGLTSKELTSVSRALRLVGDQWNLLVVREVFSGTRRFSEFKEKLGISDAVLCGRLANLLDQGVLVTVEYSKRPPRSEYRLTDQGLDLWPIFMAIWVWEARWARGSGPWSTLVHVACGHDAVPSMACGGCGEIDVGARDTVAELPPDTVIKQSRPNHAYRRSSVRASADSTHLHPELLTLLGDRWSIAILGGALLGLRRFGEFEEALGISPILLSDRLTEFVEDGVMIKVPVADGARRQEYRLAAKGLDLMPLFTLINDWGRRWFDEPDGGSLTVVHRSCGESLDARWICDGCGIALQRDTIRYEMGNEAAAPHQPGVAEQAETS